MNLIWFLIIGILAGWIASMLMRGRGLGLIGDLIVGVLGAVIGGFILGTVGVEAVSLMGELVSAVIGAIVLLGIVSFFKKSTA